jgi:CRP-like cAMP-binding protein
MRQGANQTTGRRIGAPAAALSPGGGADDAARRLDALLETGSVARHAAPDTTLCVQGEPADHLYRIISGTVRLCVYSESGRRHILHFARRGDVLGIFLLENWRFTAEAVDDVVLGWLSRRGVETEIAGDPALQAAHRRRVAREIESRERLLICLADLPAADRLFAFLEDFAPTATRRDGYARLPMTRQDIGDHLGLSLETVSRAFGELRRRGAIETSGHDRYRIRALRPHRDVA